MLGNPPQNNAFILDRILIPVILLIILLLGNYGIFLGHNFFVNETAYQVYLYHAENMKSSGWRPDLGLGLSFFFGDAGVFHVWALFRWWNHLFSSPLIGYNASVMSIIWVGCLTQFIFLRKTLPSLGRTISVLLSCLVAFGAQRHTNFFIQAHGALLLISIPLISLILHDFLSKPSTKHYFYYTLTLVVAVVFGSTITLIQSLFFSCAFFFAFGWFQGWHKNWTVLRLWIVRFFFLNLSSGFSILILVAWALYSIFVENQASNYVRDPNYVSEHFFRSSINVKFIFQQLMAYAQPSLFSRWSSVLGLQQTLGVAGKNCFSILLPIVLLITLFHKSKNFWEFAFKCLFVGTVLYQVLLELAPGLMNVFKYFRPVVEYSAVLHIFGVLGLGICLSRGQSNELRVSGKLSFLIRCVAGVLCFLYSILFTNALLSIYAPDTLNTLFANMWNVVLPYINSPSLIELIPDLISGNVRLFHETMGTSYLFFYSSSIAIMGLFCTRYGIDFMKWKGGVVFAGILLANQVFLSWAVYPLNSQPPIWEQHFSKDSKLASTISSTDRVMRVGWPRCNTTPDYFDCIKRKFLGSEFGPRRWIPGFMGTSPIFELSIGKTHTQKEVSEFIKTLIKPQDFPGANFAYGLNRTLQLDPPIYSSKLYDIVGVKYLLSLDPLEETDRVKLAYSGRQFFLYRYLDSWPYFYLANRIKTISRYEDLLDAEKGTAYLWEKGPEISIPHGTQESSGTIKLALFEYDRMEFDYESDKAEFLVIADAWHQHWHAKVNDVDTKIVKANGVFKGILLPPGKGRVHLYFDNSPYKPGIWISIVGWILFIGGWIVFSRRSRTPTTPDSLNLAN